MRIAHVVDYYQPQLGYQEAFLAKEQRRAGHEVHILTSDRYFPFPDYADTVGRVLGPRVVGCGTANEDGIVVHRLPVRLELASRVWLVGLERVLVAIEPDVAFVHSLDSFTALRVARCTLRTEEQWSLVTDCHSTGTNSGRALAPLWRTVYRRLLLPQVLKANAGIVSVSQATTDFLRKWYRIPMETIALIPLCADTDLFKWNELDRACVRRELGISPTDVLFVYTGKLLPEKHIHTLLEALHRLLACRMDRTAKVLLVGNAPPRYWQSLATQMQELDIVDLVAQIGMVRNQELPRFLSAADVGVFPGTVTVGHFEAMSCGLPIIVSDYPECQERVRHDNGLVCRTGSAESLCSAMNLLMSSKHRRTTMGRNGRRAVEKHYSWDAASRRFLEVAGRGAEGTVAAE